jgi:hypothetical protein
MYLIREIVHCKPGKVKPLIEKFKAMNEIAPRVGMPKMRIMTDFCAEQYWTAIAEMEVASVEEFEQAMTNPQGSPDDLKAMEKAMDGYHDLVISGRREIFRIEM